MRREVIEAARDYKYLLNRGYNQKTILDLVTSRYMLTHRERALLLRCIHRDDEVRTIRNKTIKNLEGNTLVIDGYNTLLTVVSAFEGRDLYLCDDCIVRDLRSSYIKDFSTPLIGKALEILANELLNLRVSKVIIVLDKNVSWSAKHARIIGNLMPWAEVRLARKADIEVMSIDAVVSSSDFLILRKSKKVYDLAGSVVMKYFPHRVLRLDTYVCIHPCVVLNK